MSVPGSTVLARRNGLPLLLLIAAATALYLVGNATIPLWDRDEPRYAQCSRQMLQTGDWVVPHYLGELRTKKPPLIYWCQATAMKFLGDGEFAARLPSVIATVGVLALLAVTVYRFVGAAAAFWTALVFSTSLLIIFTAKICLTDSVLLLWITIGQLCLLAIYRGRANWPIVICFWIALGLGALTKGTNIAIHAATLLTLAALEVGRNWRSARAWLGAIRWWRRLRPMAGIPIFLLVVMPWVILVAHRQPEFLPSLFGNVGKHVGASAEGHAAPPGYYLATIWACFLPWSLLLPLVLVTAWRNRASPLIRFSLAGIIGPWIFVELMLSKLPHYLLPAYPALAFLTADLIVRTLRHGDSHFRQPGFVRGIGIWSLIVIALGLTPLLVLPRFGDTPLGIGAALLVIAVVYAVTVFILFYCRHPGAGLMAMGLGMLPLCAILFGLYLPRVGFLRVSIGVADLLKANGAAGRSTDPCPAYMLDYKEPSLAFYQGGSIRENRAMILTQKLLDASPPWLVVTRQVWDSPRTESAARQRLEIIGTFKGLDIAAGMREVEVIVAHQRDHAAATYPASP